MNSEAKRPRPVIPEVDGDKCVHGRSPSASCRACVEACPTGAFVLDDDMLGIRESACDGCGLCRPVCPERAITQSFAPLLRRNDKDALAIFACCERAAVSGPGRIACVHALSRNDIERLERRGLAFIGLMTGDCPGCPRGKGPDVSRMIGDHNRWRVARGLGALELRIVTDEAGWRRALALYADPAERVDPSRRRLLAAFRGNLDENRAGAEPAKREEISRVGWLYHHRPQIDAHKCNGCDACINVCPHQVLSLARGGETGSFYAADPADCTGCGLCRDVCSQQAITLAGLGPDEAVRVPLSDGKCYKCGVPYHRPAAQGSMERGLCRICIEKDPTSKLFQVYD